VQPPFFTACCARYHA